MFLHFYLLTKMRKGNENGLTVKFTRHLFDFLCFSDKDFL